MLLLANIAIGDQLTHIKKYGSEYHLIAVVEEIDTINSRFRLSWRRVDNAAHEFSNNWWSFKETFKTLERFMCSAK